MWGAVEAIWDKHVPVVQKICKALEDRSFGVDTTHNVRRHATYCSTHMVSCILRLIIDAVVSDKRVPVNSEFDHSLTKIVKPLARSARAKRFRTTRFDF